MKTRINESIEYCLEWYEGSLDFDCNFCGKNSYKNFHIERDDSLKIVVCEDCLAKVKKEQEQNKE